MTQAKNTICLWYDGDAEEAARFYAETFPDSSVERCIKRREISGREGRGCDHGRVYCYGHSLHRSERRAEFKHNEAFSFQVATEDQEETDRYWNAIVDNGGEESMCGWCRDKWGLSWQITPIVLTEGYTDPDPAVAKRVFEAMMTMKKIDVAAIEAARAGK